MFSIYVNVISLKIELANANLNFMKSSCLNVPYYKGSIGPFLNRFLLLIFESPFLAQNIQNHCCTENTGFRLMWQVNPGN